jgi:hypothetical protein
MNDKWRSRCIILVIGDGGHAALHKGFDADAARSRPPPLSLRDTGSSSAVMERQYPLTVHQLRLAAAFTTVFATCYNAGMRVKCVKE